MPKNLIGITLHGRDNAGINFKKVTRNNIKAGYEFTWFMST